MKPLIQSPSPVLTEPVGSVACPEFIVSKLRIVTFLRFSDGSSGTLSGKRSTIFVSRVRSPSLIANPTAVEVKVLLTEWSTWAVSGVKNFSASTFPCWTTMMLWISSLASAMTW